MKKALVLTAVAAAGFAVFKKIKGGKAEQTLWAEVTDKVK